MAFQDDVKRKIVRSFGRPELAFKIYDSLGDDANVDALLAYMEQRGMHKYAFAGVGHIFIFPDFGPTGDIQVYGRSNLEEPEDVYPYSIILPTGEDLPPEYGRACLEETEMFGKEASLYSKLGFNQWLKVFAV
jgi:hypothetical protein